MSAEAVRLLNAIEMFALVWVWVTWVLLRIPGRVLQALALLVTPIFCWVSVGAYNGAVHHLEVNGVIYAGPWVITPALLALLAHLLLWPRIHRREVSP